MGGTNQDKAPVGHAAACPCCHKLVCEDILKMQGEDFFCGIRAEHTAEQ